MQFLLFPLPHRFSSSVKGASPFKKPSPPHILRPKAKCGGVSRTGFVHPFAQGAGGRDQAALLSLLLPFHRETLL